MGFGRAVRGGRRRRNGSGEGHLFKAGAGEAIDRLAFECVFMCVCVWYVCVCVCACVRLLFMRDMHHVICIMCVCVSVCAYA